MVRSDANNSKVPKASGAHETKQSTEDKALDRGQELDSESSLLDTATDPVTLENGH
jgi:hypothetical protein